MNFENEWKPTGFGVRLDRKDFQRAVEVYNELRVKELYIRKNLEPAILECYKIINELYADIILTCTNKEMFLKAADSEEILKRALICREIKFLNLNNPINFVEYVLKYCFFYLTNV